MEQEIFFSKDTFSVTVYSATDKELASEERDADSAPKNSLTYVFHTLSSSRVSPSRDQALTDGKNFIRAEYSYKGVTKSMICYFSADNEKSGYYIDEEDNKFLIPDNVSNIFLSLPQSEIFYSNSIPHTLTTIDGDRITPKSVQWYYKTVNDSYRKSTPATTTDKTYTYDITGAIDFSFDVPPKFCQVNIYDKSGLIYNGTGEGLSSLPIDHSEDLRVTVLAEWENNESTDSYGVLSYEFYVSIKNRSVFTLSSPRVRKGGFVILGLSNVKDLSKLKFSSSIDIPAPEFKWFNGALRAVIQIPEDTQANEITFDISYGASGDTLSVELINAVQGEAILSDYGFSDGPSANKYFDGIKASVISNYPSTNELVYFLGNFLDPTASEFTSVFSHGDTLIFGDEAQHTATAYGNEYSADQDTSVKVLQNGIVAKVAYDDYLGNYVVVDHGCGLMTYYAHLDYVDVSFGDILLTGQHIGVCGQNHLGGYGFSLYCVVDGASIPPQSLWENEIKR